MPKATLLHGFFCALLLRLEPCASICATLCVPTLRAGVRARLRRCRRHPPCSLRLRAIHRIARLTLRALNRRQSHAKAWFFFCIIVQDQIFKLRMENLRVERREVKPRRSKKATAAVLVCLITTWTPWTPSPRRRAIAVSTRDLPIPRP